MSDVNRNVVNYTGLDEVYDAVVEKGVTPESHALSDICDAIDSISGGGSGIVFYKTLRKPHAPYDPTGHFFDRSLSFIMLIDVVPEE